MSREGPAAHWLKGDGDAQGGLDAKGGEGTVNAGQRD